MKSKPLQIFFLYAEECSSCKMILSMMESIAVEKKIPIQILKYHYDDKVAVSIAVNNDIEDLPGIVFGSSKNVLQGKLITQEQLEEAMEKAWELN